MYALGIDLGTTYTAAAVWRAGRAEIASLGSHSAAIPSVVLLRADETFLTGESASRRGLSEPHRVAREFKRRLGDPTPILLGGVPHSAESLTARLLRAVIDAVAAREGSEPAAICVSHPANWGPYKTDLMRQVIRIAGVEQPVRMITEPQAAAVFYAQQQRLEPGADVAVYDLGGGTFDAAVLRKTADGFQLIGQPEGIERLGGIDFDAAIFAHVAAALDGALDRLDEDDPAVIAAVARLREECVRAKEALSADTDAAIPVLLPNLSTEVRLTRSELESMTRPVLHGSIEALRRAVRSAGVEPAGLHSVLLVGGSSRIPLVAQLVGSELGRPVAVDAHPKHAVALGAAWQASLAITESPNPPERSTPSERSTPLEAFAAPDALAAPEKRALSETRVLPETGALPERKVLPEARPLPMANGRADMTSPPATSTPALPAAVDPWAADAIPLPESPATPFRWATGSSGPASPISSAHSSSPTHRPSGHAPDSLVNPTSGYTPGDPPESAPALGVAGISHAGHRTARDGAAQTAFSPAPAPAGRRGDRRALLPIAVGTMAAVLVGAGAAVAVTLAENGWQDDSRTTAARHGANHANATNTAKPADPAKGTFPETAAVPLTATVPVDEQCTAEMKRSTRWVCLTRATIRDGKFTLWYEAEWAGTPADTEKGFHLHIYGGDGQHPDEESMGTHTEARGRYFYDDEEPSVRWSGDGDFEMVSGTAKVCARISRTGHGLEKAADGSYHTGNCIPIDRD